MEDDADQADWTSLVLLERIRAGDDSAAEAIFVRYVQRVTLLARSRLSARLARRTDPEDIVQSVYRSFFVGVHEGRYVLGRGGDLWRLLAAIARHKLLRQARHQHADRRSIDREWSLDRIDESLLAGRERAPSAEEALALADELEQVFAGLDSFARRVLELRLQGSRSRRSPPRPAGPNGRSGAPWPGSGDFWPDGSTMTDDDLESRCLRFEQDWARRGPVSIADFLEGPPIGSTSDRRRLLVELVAIDLEFRWRGARRDVGSPERLGLEDYVARFPELGPLDGLSAGLIGEEYRVRHRWGGRPSHEGFLARFPARGEEIRAELVRIDEELDRESAGPVARPCPRPEPPEPVGGVPWLSHRDLLLRRLIGAGRIGKVYQARQPAEGREVAVKFLRKTLLQEPRIIRRFIGEAATVAALDHPGIVATRGIGRTDGGSYFIVMDLIDGPDLARLARIRRIHVGEAVRWTIAACEALEHAHEKGVVHCDLKPANLLLDASGEIHLTDFGLSRSLGGPSPWAAEVEGTGPFMAPEQVSPSWGRIDRRTDVYGIGAVLFTLLTGRPPHVGRRLPDVLAEVVGAAPVVSPDGLRPDLPRPIVEFCRRCLAKPPEERYPTVRDARMALAGLAGYDE